MADRYNKSVQEIVDSDVPDETKIQHLLSRIETLEMCIRAVSNEPDCEFQSSIYDNHHSGASVCRTCYNKLNSKYTDRIFDLECVVKSLEENIRSLCNAIKNKEVSDSVSNLIFKYGDF